jgi:hypothetical protein
MSEPNTPESAAPAVDENQVITERRAKLAAIIAEIAKYG